MDTASMGYGRWCSLTVTGHFELYLAQSIVACQSNNAVARMSAAVRMRPADTVCVRQGTRRPTGCVASRLWHGAC